MDSLLVKSAWKLWMISSSLQAKTAIHVKCFLTSADEETLALEREIVRERATKNSCEFQDHYRSRRGQRLA